MATSGFRKTLCGIYIYMGPIYIHMKYQRLSQKMMTLIKTCGPKGPKEIRVINIRNNIYNKSPLRISFPEGAARVVLDQS